MDEKNNFLYIKTEYLFKLESALEEASWNHWSLNESFLIDSMVTWYFKRVTKIWA
jgi:hypothetical protein